MMNPQPLISFIVPIFNKESTLKRCVDSILNQTYRHFEIILVDDGSEDGSYALCQNLYGSLNNVKIARQTNQGVSSARNLGLELAEGEFISFVDADDFLSPCFAESTLSFGGCEADLISCSCYATTENGDIPQHFFPESFDVQNDILKKKEIFYQLMDTNYGQNQPVYTGIGVPWGKLIRKSLLDDNKLRFNTTLLHYEDNLFIHEIYYLTNRIVYFNECLYHYSTSHISTLLSQYNREVVNSYLLLYDFRDSLIRRNRESNDDDMILKFKYSSLDLFDVAVFIMIVGLMKASIFKKSRIIKRYVEGTGYREFFKTGIQNLNLTPRRRFLYRMLSHKLYLLVVLATTLRNRWRVTR